MKEISQDFEMELINETQIFIKKVEKGLIQIELGLTIPQDEVKQIVNEW
ncbi:MAG: hypothetical protein WCP85_08950 [Mariniphaga sp.]